MLHFETLPTGTLVILTRLSHVVMKSPSGVSKKIIYLDQCLLSRMVKMLDPDFPQERKNQPGFDLSFVRDAFGKLHRL